MSQSLSGPNDLVGWIVAEDERGEYVYGCAVCAPGNKREIHREVRREEASDSEAVCDCGNVLEDEEEIGG